MNSWEAESELQRLQRRLSQADGRLGRVALGVHQLQKRVDRLPAAGRVVVREVEKMCRLLVRRGAGWRVEREVGRLLHLCERARVQLERA